jgi:TPR repeat protein
MSWRLVPIAVAIAVAAGGAQAGFDEGLALYAAGNYGGAFQELRRAAELGDARAEGLLARMYLAGQGVRPDTAEGMKWERKAAEHGIAATQVELGMRYEYGLDLPQDLAAAAQWYRAAAERNSPIGQYRLGLLYVDGRGVPQDPVLGHMWLNLAASQLPAGNARNAVVRARDTVGNKLTVEQMKQAQTQAREWHPIQ